MCPRQPESGKTSKELDGTRPIPRCVTCGYILDHLESNRCPECGRPFNLRDQSTFEHDYGYAAPWDGWAAVLSATAWMLLPIGVIAPSNRSTCLIGFSSLLLQLVAFVGALSWLIGDGSPRPRSRYPKIALYSCLLYALAIAMLLLARALL